MSKIFIDTNILLKFYRMSERAMTDLIKSAPHIVVTRQSIYEFERSRVTVILLH